jgi:hypothetical protein
MVPKLEDHFARAIPKDSEALKLLMGYVGILDEIQLLANPELCHAVVDHVYDLVALALRFARRG